MQGGAGRLKLQVKAYHKCRSWHVVKPPVVTGNLHAICIRGVKNVIYRQKYLALFNVHIIIAEGVVQSGVKHVDVGQAVYFGQSVYVAGWGCGRCPTHPGGRVNILKVLVITAELEVVKKLPLKAGLKGKGWRVWHFACAYAIVPCGPSFHPSCARKEFKIVGRRNTAGKFKAINFIFCRGRSEKIGSGRSSG